MVPYTLAIHGGAGTILKEDLTPDLERAYKQALEDGLTAGFAVLKGGGSAFDAVTAATIVLEDNVLFNAGRGSVFTNKGLQEMDAAVMDGSTLFAGAVSGVRHVRNPVMLATEVMKRSNHVFLSGEGAMDFAKSRGLVMEEDDYFFSQFRYNQWLEIKDTDSYALEHSDAPDHENLHDKKFGTVGAVACDAQGNLAAATSTGGMTNKRWGRIGDSPIIGAGTYANNGTCAISCTGHGEVFIRAVAAYDVSCLMEYKGMSLQAAMDVVVNNKLVKLAGEGGMIGVDALGNAALVFNSAGMYRGVVSSSGLYQVSIYK
jgi:beta-aspartyl-peptidase (threonine type)